MKIISVAGMATITKDADLSNTLYRDSLGLPLKGKDDYWSMDGFKGIQHFGVWSLAMAAQACFGQDIWPDNIPEPQATIEFELADVEAVAAAVVEMKAQGQKFVHEARLEPWGQTLARFVSPEGLLIGLSYAPWLHEEEKK